MQAWSDEVEDSEEQAEEKEEAEQVNFQPEPVKAPEPAAKGTASAQVRMEPVKLEDWIRRRVFELRLSLGMSPDVLLATLQNLEDEQLQAPFTEVKLWLGLDEAEPLPAGLDQLVLEFRSARGGGVSSSSAPPAGTSWGGSTSTWNSAGWRGGSWNSR